MRLTSDLWLFWDDEGGESTLKGLEEEPLEQGCRHGAGTLHFPQEALPEEIRGKPGVCGKPTCRRKVNSPWGDRHVQLKHKSNKGSCANKMVSHPATYTLKCPGAPLLYRPIIQPNLKAPNNSHVLPGLMVFPLWTSVTPPPAAPSCIQKEAISCKSFQKQGCRHWDCIRKGTGEVYKRVGSGHITGHPV